MKLKLTILSLVAPLVFVLDQLTKRMIVRSIPLGGSIPILPGLFDVIHTRNRGAAFGFMANLPDSLRLPFFFVVSTAALALILVYFFRLKDTRKSVYICLALILGGAAGNIWDRVTLGEVIDFLSFHWYDASAHWTFGNSSLRFRWEWPAFNVADSAITVAVIGLMLLMMFPGPHKDPKH